MFLVDIGSGAYTAYEVDKGGFKAADIVELFEAFPGLETGELKAHHIHTHHSMGAFMSATDWSQLNDRGYVSNYFLMLVVDTKHKKWDAKATSNVESWEAHVGFRAKISQPRYQKTYQKTILGEEQVILVNNMDGYPNLVMSGKAKDEIRDEEVTDPIEKEVLCVMQCNVVREVMEEPALRPFQERYKKVAAAMATPAYGSGIVGGYSGIRSPETTGPSYVPGAISHFNPSTSRWEEIKDTKETGTPTTKKKISDMTQREWEQFEKDNPRDTYKFEHRHARAFLNASLEPGQITGCRMDCTDAMGSLREFEKSSPREIEWYVDNVIYELRDWQSEWFPGASNEEYLELLGVITDYLLPYKNMDIIPLILREIEIEVGATKEELIKESIPKVGETDEQEKAMDSGGYGGWAGGDY